MDKPDLSSGCGGWVDPDFLPKQLRAELLLHLASSPLTSQQRESLLTFANDMGQMILDGELQPGQEQREQIEKIATSARRLLANLNTLGEPARQALQAHADYLAFGTTPPVRLAPQVKAAIQSRDGNLLSSAWDWVAALELASEYTAKQYSVSRQNKPEEMRSRAYVSMLAGHVRDVTGALPPVDRSAWFAAFFEALAAHLNIPGGPRIVASGIDAAR
jgi:hypothetical protein